MKSFNDVSIFERYRRRIHTWFINRKQNKEFWHTNPSPGQCPYSPGPIIMKREWDAITKRLKEEKKHAS